MKNYNIILTEKQQKYKHQNITYGRIDKYEYLTGEELLISN